MVNDEYFWLLADAEHRATIISYCKKHELSIEIVPVTIQEPGVMGENNYFTLGYKFIHLTLLSKAKYPGKPPSLEIAMSSKRNSAPTINSLTKM